MVSEAWGHWMGAHMACLRTYAAGAAVTDVTQNVTGQIWILNPSFTSGYGCAATCINAMKTRICHFLVFFFFGGVLGQDEESRSTISSGQAKGHVVEPIF